MMSSSPYQDAAASQQAPAGSPYSAYSPGVGTPQMAPAPDPSQFASSSSNTAPASTSSSLSATQAGTSQSQQQQQQQSRLVTETARKDKTLAEFLLMLDDFEPLIPNEVTDYYLQRVGFECDDPRLKRLLSLAAQKFVSDIASDAYQHARIRTNAAGGRSRVNVTGPQSARDKTKTTLMMEDLSAALAEYGITSKKPEFYM